MNAAAMMDCYIYSVCLVLLMVTLVNAKQVCTGVRHMAHNHFQIKSPNYGPRKRYPPNTKCQWDIPLSPNQKAKLSFRVFDLEYLPGCKWDGVEIHSGTCSNKGPSVVRHCGVISPPAVVIEGAACLTFWSDAVGNKKGFKLNIFLLKTKNDSKDQHPDQLKEHQMKPTFRTKSPATMPTTILKTDIPVPESVKENQRRKLQLANVLMEKVLITNKQMNPYKTTENIGTSTTYNTYQRTTTPLMTRTINATTNAPTAPTAGQEEQLKEMSPPSCSSEGVVLTAKEATIQSPNYGSGNYPTDITCKWIIKRDPGERIRITFTDFDLEWERDCKWDSLTVNAGENATGSNLMGRFCGSRLPPNITSTGSMVMLTFRSDRVTSLRGFRLKYRLLRATKTNTGV